jgi:thioredoxin-like negative regulator of GroEL
MLLRTAVLLLVIASSSFATQSIQWVRDYDQALAKAAKDSKPIFVDAYADWCGWCHKLDQEVYSDPSFVKFMSDFVPLKIDIESSTKGRQFAEKYQITGLPTLFVLDSSGKISNRIGGFIEAGALMEDIQGIQRLIEAEQKDPSNLNVSGKLADEYLAREMTDEATERFRKIVISPYSSASQKESAQFSLGLAHYSQGDLNNAQKVIEQYLQSFPQGENIEDAYLLIAQICIEKEEDHRAQRYLKQFLQKFPQSKNVPRAKDVLAALESGSGEQDH